MYAYTCIEYFISIIRHWWRRFCVKSLRSAILNVSHMYIKFSNLCGSVEDEYCQELALVFSVGNVWAYSHSLSITGTRILSETSSSANMQNKAFVCTLDIYGQCTAILIWNMKKEISQFSRSSNWFHIVPKAVKTAPGHFFSKCSLGRQKLHTHSAHVDTVDQVNSSRMIMEHAFGQWTENYYGTTSCALLDSKFF